MLITTTEALHEMIEELKDVKVLSLDTETNGLHPYQGNRILGISLYSPDLDKSWYVSFRHLGDNVPLDRLPDLYDLLSNPVVEYYGYNVKFDLHFLQADGFPILQRGVIYQDVMIALHLLDENRGDLADKRGLNYKLKDNARLYLGVESAEAEDELKELFKERKLGKGDMGKLEAHYIARYAEDDTKLTWQLYQFFLPYLEKWNQVELFKSKAKLNSTILARMEYNGVPVSVDKIKDDIENSKVKAQEILVKLQSIYGKDFNPNSPQQITQALGTKNSSKAVLEQHHTEDSQLILDYKFYKNGTSKFYNPYLKFVGLDGKIHPTFNLTRTNSGRLSATDPNLQQIPREGEHHVKQVFTAPEGYKWVELDFKTEELALCAHFSQDENSSRIIAEGADLHAYTAAKLFNVPESAVTKAQRFIGKTGNFGLCYGMGLVKWAKYLSEKMKKSVYVDQTFFEENFKRLPKLEYTLDSGAVVKRDMSWKKFVEMLGAWVVVVDDINDLDDECLTIAQTTILLDEWKKLFKAFVDKAKETTAEANTLRKPDGSLADPSADNEFDRGYKFLRLADNTVRHYIKGQRPFTSWNMLIQGTGGIEMRRSLAAIDKAFPMNQDEVIPMLTVHDSFDALVKDNENFRTNVMKIKACMENFNYYPPLRVDVKVGLNYGECVDYE